jgi:hypothetical protein
MRGLTLLFVGLAAAQSYPKDEVDKLVDASLPKLKEYLEKHPQGNCTLETAVRRKEWLVNIAQCLPGWQRADSGKGAISPSKNERTTPMPYCVSCPSLP